MKQITIVLDVEHEPVAPLGVYVRTDEDVVVFRELDGGVAWAPQDCVRLVTVEVPA